ncbi:uncharacterized protein LOC144124469 isoform X3 [Amblyomma americanum]
MVGGLEKLLDSSRDSGVLTRATAILEAAVQSKSFVSNVTCCQRWLSAAKTLVAKEEASADVLRSIVQCLHKFVPIPAGAASDWCQVGLLCLLQPEVRMEAHAALCSQRKATLAPLRRGTDAPVYAAIKDCIGPQLSRWMEGSQGSAALQVWTLIIQWMGEYLPQNAASVNVLLRVASKGFAASSQPQLQCQALDSWQVLISTFKPETLRMHKMLVLVMTPLRQRPSADPLVRLALVRTLWHLAVKLGPQHLATSFQQVGVTLLKTLAGFLAEVSTPTQSGCDSDNLRRECLCVLLRLLQLPVDPGWQSAMEGVSLASLASPLETGVLGRHLEGFDQTCRTAITFIQQSSNYAPELGCLLMHLLLKRAAEAHSADSVPVAAALLKLVLDGLTDWLPAAPLACKTVLWEASHLPEKMLTSHCYYSGKQGQLHGTPVLSLLKLVLQPPLLAVFNSTEEVTQLFQRLLTLGLQNPSRLHLLQSVLGCLERCPPAAVLACTLWLALASAVLTCVQAGNEVNQGSDLEPDFSALVATLAFPVHHGLPSADAKLRKAVTRRWLQLYRAFSCAAVLVPNESPNSICHETWRRLCPALTEQLKEDVGYVDAVCDLLAAAGPSQNLSASSGSSPGPPMLSGSPCWGQRPHRGSALAELQPYCQALAWALDAIARMCPGEARRSASGGKLVRPVQDLVGCLRGVPPLVEAVGLLAPPMSALLASGQAPKVVEPMWVSLCGALVSQRQAAWLSDEQSLLVALTPLLEAALRRCTRGPVHDRTVHLWHTVFAQRPNLQVPPRLRDVLCKAKLLPDLESEELALCVPVSVSQDSLVPDAELPRTPQKRELAVFSPSPTARPTILRVRRAASRASPRKGRSVYDVRAEEFVVVRDSVEKKRVLTEHQREVLKERRSLPALYSNLSQSGLDSQDSEETPQSDDMESAHPTSAENPTMQSAPVIVLDSESDECDLPSSGAQPSCTLEAQEVLPPNTASKGMVPETQQDSTPLGPAKVLEPSSTNTPVSAGSPRVHRLRARLSFAWLPTPGKGGTPGGDTEVVPSSQSTIDSSDDDMGSECQPLGDQEKPATLWVQDRLSGRLVASQCDGSPETQEQKCASLLEGGPGRWHGLLLEDGIAPLADNEPEEPSSNVLLSSKHSEEPLVNSVEEHSVDTHTACTVELALNERGTLEPFAGERPANREHFPSHETVSALVPDGTASKERILHLSMESPSCFSESTECITQTQQESSEVVVCSQETERVDLAAETEEELVALCAQGADSGREDDSGACIVQETEDDGVATTVKLQRAPSPEEASPLQTKVVRGARKRKLPSQTASPIASRLRAKKLRQGASSPPGSGGGRPPRWAGSPASMSRSRIMLDAAMRNVNSSPPSRRSTSAPLARPLADGPPTSILKRRQLLPPPTSPQEAKVPSGRRVSFADPPVQGEFQIAPPARKASCSRPLYEEGSQLEEEETLVDSQQPLWAALQGSTEPVDAVLPFLTSSLWHRSLGRKLRLQGIATVGDLASLTAAQALQLPVQPPRVASLRYALEQHASQHACPLPEALVEDCGGAPVELTAALESASPGPDSLQVEDDGVPCSQPSLLGNCQETPVLMQDCGASLELSAALGEASLANTDVTSLSREVANNASCAADALEAEASGTPCAQTPSSETCQQESPVEASLPAATDLFGNHALLEHRTSFTEQAVQTDPMVLSRGEAHQLFTPESFASLQPAELAHILAMVATALSQHSVHSTQ